MVNGPLLHGEDKCDVRSPWLQNFWISPIYLYRHGEQWKKSTAYRFSWVQLFTGKSYMSIFSFLYSCHIVQDHGHLKSRIFATMATWRINDVSSLFRSSECCRWNEVDSWLWCTDNSHMKDHNSSSKSRWVGAKCWRVKFLQQPFTKTEKNNCFSIYTLSALGNY